MSAEYSPVIETHGLAKTYKGVQALRPLDLRVQPNSICGFLGPNGAGKTTTIKLLLGLSRPTGGSARVFGMDIQHQGDEIRRRIGYLSQEPHLDDSKDVRGNVEQAVKPIKDALIKKEKAEQLKPEHIPVYEKFVPEEERPKPEDVEAEPAKAE